MQLRSAVLNFNASGDTQVIIASTYAIKVKGVSFTVSGATNITFKNGTAPVSGAYVFTANGSSMTHPILESDTFYWNADPTQAFVMNLTNAVQVSGTIWYVNG